MQLTLFVDPNEVILGSLTDDPDQWDAYDAQLSRSSGESVERVWADKRGDIETGLRVVDPYLAVEWGHDEYALNDTPLPWTFSQGRRMICDGHHRVILASERGTLLPILHNNGISFESIDGSPDWHV